MIRRELRERFEGDGRGLVGEGESNRGDVTLWAMKAIVHLQKK